MNSKLKSYFPIWCLVMASLCWFSTGSEAAELQQLDMAQDLQETRLLLNRTIVPGEDLVVQVPGPEKRQKKGPLYREGEVIVKFRKDIKTSAAPRVLTTYNLHIAKRFDVLSRIKGQNYVLLRSETLKADELLELLRKDPSVEAVSLNYLRELDVVPNDTDFNKQWSLNNTGQDILGYNGTFDADIDAPEAWDIQTGSSDVVVAVLDTGVDYSHPDLAANMWVNQAEVDGTTGVDDDDNGYVDDIYGIDTGEDDCDPSDTCGHGTHVAGTIAAAGNNNLGMAGINWNGRIMAVKGFPDTGSICIGKEIEAIEYIIDMKERGVNIVAINASYGGGMYSQFEKEAIEAAGDEGIVFVSSAGNDGNNTDVTPHYPSSYDSANIISVAATDMDDNLASFSNYGSTSVDLGAPGYLIESTYIFYWYDPGQGGNIFFDNMESGSGKWDDPPEGTWAITEEQNATSPSPTHAWSDSPGGDYVANTEYALSSETIDLSSATSPLFLGFYAKYVLEQHWDYLHIYYHGPPKTTSWERTTEEHHSGSYAWSDSPSVNYTDNLENWLASPVIDISGADDDAEVIFYITGKVEEYCDCLKILFSADGGETWAYLYYLTGDYSTGWYSCVAPIPPEFRTSQFRVIFVLSSDGTINYDGYYIDDVSVIDSDTIFFSDNMELGVNGWGEQLTPWDYIGSITGSSGGYWYLHNLPIDEEYFWDQFKVRFVLDADYLYNYDGVYLDDIGVGPGEKEQTYGFMNGTSMAAPHVTGAVALMAAQYAGEGVSDRIQRILSGVDPLSSLTGKVVTEGRLNLYNSLTAADACEGNFDGDSDVDGSDLAVFAADFGRTDCP
jgi:subtilisin family serine protease